jgi:LPXTG-motif cell wall-anchored protein
MPARPSIVVLAAALALAPPTPALAQVEPEHQGTRAKAPLGRTLPHTGSDLLPLAAAGVALLLAGLALWRRPHARR